MKYSFLIFILFFLAGCLTTGKEETPEMAKLNALVEKGDHAFSANNYIKAVQCYIDAVLEAEVYAPDRLEEIKEKLSSSYLDWARSLYWEAKQGRSARVCQKAINMAKRASDINPRIQIKCKVLIEKLNKDLASIKYEKATDIKELDPMFNQRKLQIDVLCKQAEVFFESGQFMHARDKYEEVLLIDPFNLTAIRGLKKVMKEVTKAGSERKKVEEQERMAEVEWNYVQAIVQKEKQAQKSKSDKSLPNTLEDELSENIIKELNFIDTPLDKVFSILEKEISKALKKDFKFKFEGFSPADKQLAPITFKAQDIPMDAAVRVICEGMKLDFKYLKDTILISPRKTP